MKNETCYLVEDLIPSYIDEVVTDESKKIMDEHFKTCEDCRKKLESMKGDVFVETAQNADLYDKELLKKVSLNVRKKENKTKTAFIVAITLIIGLFVFINLPIIKVNPDKLDVHTIEPYSRLDSEFVRYNQVPENAILFYDESKDLDKNYFYRVIFDDETGKYLNDVEIYADNLTNLQSMTLVQIESPSPIRKYKTKVMTIDGKRSLVVKSVKTSILGIFQKGAVSKVTVVNMDYVEGRVYVKKGKTYKIISK